MNYFFYIRKQESHSKNVNIKRTNHIYVDQHQSQNGECLKER